MEGGPRAPACEQGDHALDLPPAAIMDEVAEASAVAGAARRLPFRFAAEAADEVVGIGEGAAIGQVDMVTQLIFPLLGR